MVDLRPCLNLIVHCSVQSLYTNCQWSLQAQVCKCTQASVISWFPFHLVVQLPIECLVPFVLIFNRNCFQDDPMLVKMKPYIFESQATRLTWHLGLRISVHCTTRQRSLFVQCKVFVTLCIFSKKSKALKSGLNIHCMESF